MITPQGIRSTGANGCIFETYHCKFDELCDKQNRYNPAIKITNKYGKERLNPCCHGGGPGCKTWREETDKETGWNREKPEDRLHRTTWRPQQHE